MGIKLCYVGSTIDVGTDGLVRIEIMLDNGEKFFVEPKHEYLQIRSANATMSIDPAAENSVHIRERVFYPREE